MAHNGLDIEQKALLSIYRLIVNILSIVEVSMNKVALLIVPM